MSYKHSATTQNPPPPIVWCFMEIFHNQYHGQINSSWKCCMIIGPGACNCMFFHSHKTFYANIKSNTQLWVKKGNFIHKVPDIKQLNNWWSLFHCVQFCAFCTCLGGTTPILLTTTHVTTCYLISMTCTSIFQHHYSKFAWTLGNNNRYPLDKYVTQL